MVTGFEIDSQNIAKEQVKQLSYLNHNIIALTSVLENIKMALDHMGGSSDNNE